MSTHLGRPGIVVDLPHLSCGEQKNNLTQLVKTSQVRISHVSIPAGQQIPLYEAEGEVVFVCLRGRIALTALNETRELHEGQLLYLVINEPFSTRGIEDAQLLITVVQPLQSSEAELIGD